MQERHEMMEAEKHTPEMAGLVYWGHLQSREVVDNNGWLVGLMRGILIDKNWTISQVVVEVNREILDRIAIEQKHKLLDVMLANIPTSYVDVGSDLVRLNNDFNSLWDKIQIYEARR